MAKKMSWRTRWAIAVGAWLAAWLLRLIYLTQRWRYVGVQPKNDGRRRPCVYACWHQRMLPFLWSHRHHGIVVLVSRHRDGELITQIIKRYGFGTARGSSNRGGARALRDLAKASAAGNDVAFTPDGPRGPRFELQPGVIHYAARQGLPLVLGACSTSRFWSLTSWDRFRIPKPFGTAIVHIGEEIAVPPEVLESAEAMEAFRVDIEARLRAQNNALDAQLGLPEAEPPSEEEIRRGRRRSRRLS